MSTIGPEVQQPEDSEPLGTATDSPTTSEAPAPTATATATEATDVAERRGLRVGTVVWGLVIALVGAVILAVASGFRVDLQLTFIVLLAVAGVALLAGSIFSAARRRGR